MGEITELRKSGQLKAAYEQAKTMIQNDPSNHYLKSELGWVLWEYLKQNRSYQQKDTFLEILDELLQLNLPDSDTMVGNQVIFQAVSLMWEAGNRKEADRELILKMLRKLARLPMTIPGEAYSALLKTAVRHLENGAEQMRFIEWWNLEKNLQHIDFQKELYQERKLPSLAERAVSAVYKNLTQLDTNENPLYEKTTLEKYTRWFETLAPKHPEMEYLPYYISKLKLLLGETEGELERILPFIRKKVNNPWAWHHLAQFFPDTQTKKACLAKGLSIKSQENFYLGLRLDLAKLLIEEQDYSAAKYELQQMLMIYKKESWKIKNELQNLINAPWFETTKAATGNPYKEWAKAAENILLSELPEFLGVITALNMEKKNVRFIAEGKRSGLADFKIFSGKVQPGECFKFRLEQINGRNGVWYKALTAIASSETPPSDICRPFIHQLKFVENQKGDLFAFAENVYIPPALLHNTEFQDGEKVKGLAAAHFNTKKQEWGWQAIRLEHI
jgi:hypothetical protein